MLSEAEPSDLVLIRDAPAAGEHHRLYFGANATAGVDLEFHNHLFSVGTIVAKVFVSSRPGGSQAADAIARAAADRMAQAQAGGPRSSPAASPAASLDPDAVVALEGGLTVRVGEDVRGCRGERDRAFRGELAGIACTLAGQTLVVRLLDSRANLDRAFTDYTGSPASARGACREGPALEPRMADGEQVGQLACYTTDTGERVFIWTDERFDIIAWIVSTDATFPRLYRLYANAGPYATPYDDPDFQ